MLSGEDEARLTFLAARRWFGWSSGTLLVVDIGGGSLELAAGMDEDPDAAVSACRSAPAGSPATCCPGDPPDADVIREARRAIRRAPRRRRSARSPRPVPPTARSGTSKTMRSLARVTGAAPSSDGPVCRAAPRARGARRRSSAGSARMTRRAAGRRCRASRRAGRASCSPGRWSPRRRWTCSDLDRLDICPWALREGVILSRLDAMR